MNKTLQCGAVILGILFIILSIVYFTHSAGTLPSFVPGFKAGSSHIHYKHGVGALIVGLALFAFARFRRGQNNQPLANQ